MGKLLNLIYKVLDEHGMGYTLVNDEIHIPVHTDGFPDILIIVSLINEDRELRGKTIINKPVPKENLESLLYFITWFNGHYPGTVLNYNSKENKINFRIVTYFFALPKDKTLLKNFLYQFIIDGVSGLNDVKSEILPFFNPLGKNRLLPLFNEGTAITALLEQHSNDNLFASTNKYIAELSRLIRGKSPVIIMNTLDPQYAKFIIQAAAKSLKYDLFLWNDVDLMRVPRNLVSNTQIPEGESIIPYILYSNKEKESIDHRLLHDLLTVPLTASGLGADVFGVEKVDFKNIEGLLEWFTKSIRSYFVVGAEDFHLERLALNSKYGPGEDNTLERLRELAHLPQETKSLIIINTNQSVPDELIRFIPQVNCPLPDRGALLLWYNEILNTFGVKDAERDPPIELLDALQGMTLNEAKNALYFRLNENGKITQDDTEILAKEKRQQVNKTDYLRYIENEDDVTNIGGMDRLKEWILVRESVHSNEWKQIGVRPPKGILLVGPPGTGKTLAAKAIAKMWHRPLLELEIGTLHGGLMGDSEHNTQQALASIDGFSPCVLLIDEIEKGMSGGNGSEVYSNETSQRVVSMIMKWMQNRESDVFIVATANSVDYLPPEFLRKGRFDEIFFVDLPSQKERKEILSIHLKKRGYKLFSAKKMEHLAEITEGYSGTELETALEEAIIKAFSEKRALKGEDVESSLLATAPLSVRHAERILASRLSGRRYGIPVSSEVTEIKENEEHSLGYR